MRSMQQYKRLQKKKVLGMLNKLVKEIENGNLTISESGFYDSGLDNSIYFKVKTIPRDLEKELRKFQEFS